MNTISTKITKKIMKEALKNGELGIEINDDGNSENLSVEIPEGYASLGNLKGEEATNYMQEIAEATFQYRKRLTEIVKKYSGSKGLNSYKLTIITGRDRGCPGKIKHVNIRAKNDVDALVQVFESFDLQNSEFTSWIHSDDPEREERRVFVYDAKLHNRNIKEALQILKDEYFDSFDISDYYDNIVKLESNTGHVVFEDEGIDIEEWFSI